MSNVYFAVLGDTKVGGPWESVYDAGMRCTLVNGEIERIEGEAERRGAERMRAEIVAWLIAKTVAYGDQPNLEHLIDAIERGEFKGGDSGSK
jgi:hypothetical protein